MKNMVKRIADWLEKASVGFFVAAFLQGSLPATFLSVLFLVSACI